LRPRFQLGANSRYRSVLKDLLRGERQSGLTGKSGDAKDQQ
jgi:hypothetical protein